MKIRIKKKNRGTFTAEAKKHGKSVQAFASQVLAHKENYSPAMVKKANFARNSRKWKHGDGGFINQYDGETEETGWLRRFLNTPTRVPNMTGTATAAATGLRDIPLTDSTVGRELAVAGTAMLPLAPYLGHSAAVGIDTMGRMAMPSTLLKGVSYYAPKAAGALAAASPWLDAGALSLWSAQAGKAAIDVGKEGRTGDALGFGALSALPVVMPVASQVRGRLKNPLSRFRLSSSDIDVSAMNPGEFVHDAQVARDAADEAELARQFRLDQLGVDVPIRPVQTGEWSPEELARLQAMAGDHPMDLAAYTPEQIAQAQAQMQADASIIHDALAGNRSIAPTERFVASAPSVSGTTAGGYQIERYPGYMLKSLMEGNPLEKQMSKRGEVNVNNIRALMKKGSKMEQAVVDKVLSSEEFAGKKTIDYNRFRKAVQDELITYDRTPDTRYQNYGGESLNWGGSDKDIKEWALSKGYYKPFREKMPYERDWEWPREFIDTRTGKTYTISDLEPLYKTEHGVTLNTFTFSSPRIPNGSGKHYDANTLGHSRTYTTADEPDVLHVMESQSDWAQSKPSELLKTHDIKSVADLDEEIAFQKANAGEGYKGVDWKDELAKLEAARPYVDPETSYLVDNYTSRQIQENLRYAAEHGQTKMRYPTRETAAKIEGYTGEEAYFDAQGTDITTSGQKLFTYGKAADAEIEALKKERALITQQENWGLDQEKNERVAEINKRLSDIAHTKAELLPGITKKTVYDPEYETILRKYDAFPKQFQKLFKGSEVRTVTDSKGNTWYEVDVPEGYLQQEWPYAEGGSLVLPKMMMDKYSPDRLRSAIASVRARQRK